MTVLFNSSRPLGRCENITAVWEAYTGKKHFIKSGWADLSKFKSFNLIVSDDFIRGKALNHRMIMIGHGCCGGKTYGADQPNAYTPVECALTDFYITSSEYGRRFAASSANIPIERCLPLGMPRTDKYFGVKKGDGKTILSEYKRAYLYVPTFRSKYNKPMPHINYDYLDFLLKDNEIFVIKRHMIVKKPVLTQKYKHIYEISSEKPSIPYLIDCDVVVTDFSSIIFDGYILNKPCVLTADGNDDYLTSRGMYMSYPDSYSSKFIAVENNEEKLVKLMRKAYRAGMTKVERKCRELSAGACDGHSTERVIQLINDMV